MAWVNTFAASTWNATDEQLVQEATYHLLENGAADATGTSFVTPMYTVAQLVAALNDRQRQFIKDTGVVVMRATEAVTPQVGRYSLPTDWLDTRRLTYQNAGPPAGNIAPLVRSDGWELNHMVPDWQYNFADPVAYREDSLPTLTVEVAKAPSNQGTLGLLYTQLGAVLTGLGVPMAIPDEMAWAVKYGAMADLLKQDGEGQDMQRAAYCEQRYQMGVELAKMLLRGPVESQQQGVQR